MNIDDRSLHKMYLIISRVGRDKSYDQFYIIKSESRFDTSIILSIL